MIDIKSVYKIMVICFVTGLVGFFIHPYFVQLSVSEMKGVSIVTLDTDTAFNLKILMGIICLFIPLFHFTVLKVLNLEKKRDKLFVLISIILSGVIFWQYKLYSIQERFNELRAQTSEIKINYVFAQENLNLEFYLFIGLIVGALIAGLALYRFRSKKS